MRRRLLCVPMMTLVLLTACGGTAAGDPAEELALAKTMARYSDEFVEAVEFFGQALKDAFDSAAAPAAAEEGCGGPAAGV